MRPTLGGMRLGVASETPIIVANAIGTVHAAGWASSAAVQPLWVFSSSVSTTAPPDSSPPTSSPAIAPDVGEPSPPDAEHDQRAERARRDGERQPDGPRDADALGGDREQRGAR